MKDFQILIADDDEDDFLTIQEAFKAVDQSPRLHHLANGRQVLEYLHDCVAGHRSLPDLILLDINMPKVDGMQALERIKKTLSLCDIPVLIYSTSTDKEQIKRCYALGANGFVTKGYSFSAVIDFVKTLGKYFTTT